MFCLVALQICKWTPQLSAETSCGAEFIKLPCVCTPIAAHDSILGNKVRVCVRVHVMQGWKAPSVPCDSNEVRGIEGQNLRAIHHSCRRSKHILPVFQGYLNKANRHTSILLFLDSACVFVSITVLSSCPEDHRAATGVNPMMNYQLNLEWEAICMLSSTSDVPSYLICLKSYSWTVRSTVVPDRHVNHLD